MNKIPIVLTFNNAWAKIPACVCIASLLENASPSTHYEIVVVSSDISEKNKAALTRQVDLYRRHSIYFIEYALKNYHQSCKKISLDTYTRLFLPDILECYSKVIYADSDLIFQCDLSDYFNTDIRDNYLAAVLDINANGRILKDQYPGFKPSFFGSFFNAGFLLMNLDFMRTNRTPEKTEALAQNSDRNYLTDDQLIANKLFCPNVIYLPLKYNYFSRYLGDGNDEVLLKQLNVTDAYFEARKAPSVIHFTWTKPWQVKSLGYAQVWWRYARKTPYYWRAQNVYLIYQTKELLSVLKKVRQWLIQIRWKKDKRIVRLCGVCFVRSRGEVVL